MAKFSTTDSAIRDLAERQSVQQPKEGDIDSLQMFQESVPGGSRLTLEFPVGQNWRIHVQEIAVDFALNTNYIFLFNGQRWEGDNLAAFSMPQTEEEKVTIVIENFNAAAVVYSGHIKAWATPR